MGDWSSNDFYFPSEYRLVPIGGGNYVPVKNDSVARPRPIKSKPVPVIDDKFEEEIRRVQANKKGDDPYIITKTNQTSLYDF